MEANSASHVAAPLGTMLTTVLRNFWEWARSAVKSRNSRRLRLCETLSLGDRRLVALIKVDRHEFLLAGSGSSLVLLARLHDGMVAPETREPRESFTV